MNYCFTNHDLSVEKRKLMKPATKKIYVMYKVDIQE